MRIKFNTKSKKKKRAGRGISAGRGKTAGRGTKGQKSRSGYRTKRGFEGGQNPLTQRIPKKRGFKGLEKAEVSVLNISQLNKFKEGEVINFLKLKEKGLISKLGVIKILGGGELKKKLIIEADFFSKQAKNKIKKAGGEVREIK